MIQDYKNDSGPWYNPENLNINTENCTEENQNDQNYAKNENQTGSKKNNGDNMLSETEDNALVFGAISMVLGIFSLLGEKLVFGILGLVFGKISSGKKQNTYAKIGIICSIISLAIAAVTLIVILTICAIYGTVVLELLKDTSRITV